jgi:CBS domain-containing protein
MKNKGKSTTDVGSHLKTLRDELRVKAHLAGLDAKSLWDEFEPRLAEIEHGLEQQTEEARMAVLNLSTQFLGGFRDFLTRRAPEHGSAKASDKTLVRDLMNTRHIVCSPEDTLSRAARLMWESDVGCLPVCDAQGRAIAMITDRDICMAALTQAKILDDIPVSSAMSKELQCIQPDATLSSAEEKLQSAQIRRLPVVDEDKRVVGMISLADIVRFASRATTGKADDIQTEFTETMATICSPRVSQAAE